MHGATGVRAAMWTEREGAAGCGLAGVAAEVNRGSRRKASQCAVGTVSQMGCKGFQASVCDESAMKCERTSSRRAWCTRDPR